MDAALTLASRLTGSVALTCWLLAGAVAPLPSSGMAYAQDAPPAADATPDATAPATPDAAAPAATDAAGACPYLTADEALQYLGFVVSEIVLLPGGCALRTADGSHSAPNAVRNLNGHDGVLIGIAAGQTQLSPRCQQQSIPGVPTPGGVCLTGDTAIVGFDLDNGRAAAIQIYASNPPTLDAVDAIAALAYQRMN